MRIGTIVKNEMALLETYFVYTGENARGNNRLHRTTIGYGITRQGSEWMIRRDVYGYDDLQDHKKYPRVGYIDIEQVLKKDILKAIGIDNGQKEVSVEQG